MALSKKRQKILAKFRKLREELDDAYKRDDRRALIERNYQFADYVREYQKEIGCSDEFVEQMRLDSIRIEKNIAEQIYEEEKTIRLKRELAELEKNRAEAVENAERRGKLKWQ
jgi:hypothetical protein